jgi:hypothetical protein
MPCCGGKRARAQMQADPPAAGPTRRDRPRSPQVLASGPPSFELVGARSLTVDGPGSGRRYRFAHPGAVVVVDARDASALSAVSALRQLSG